MPESPEHEFLSDSALKIMASAARSGLYTYKEGARKLFDFSCDLRKDWSKVISGQTLWKHDRDGIDKDLRTLLTDENAAAAVYVARHSTTNRGRVSEVAGAYRATPMRERLSRLRVFWIPNDFDADDERAREETYKYLKEEMTRDLLMHVVLGGLTPQDVSRFAGSRRPGYPLAILSHIRLNGFGSLAGARKALGLSDIILKEEIQRLFIIGLLESDEVIGGRYKVSDSGNAMLDICSRLRDYLNESLGDNQEFEHICHLLGIDYGTIEPSVAIDLDFRSPTALLLHHVAQADSDRSVEWPEPYFALPSM
ncbi:hypothetical protein [Streptomyces sp.]|uniref:hypothetical protein n=1 Tax=Streptomyces sp. TaxID=1931 RepID=UPI002D76EA1B|nr:hypothetical protein [Streptomyces sp.]HET6355108.1 hypothetical protein [Streptomyces sp.]